MRLFGQISKVDTQDDGTIIVEGIASTECVDRQGEVVKAEAMKAALPEYLSTGKGPLREMHQPMAAGFVFKAEVDEQGRTIIAAKVVDPVAVKKVQEGVYQGFSIGGKAIDKADGVISNMRLTEISLVDRPANPESMISMWKGDDIEGEDNVESEGGETGVKAEVDPVVEDAAKAEVVEEKVEESIVKVDEEKEAAIAKVAALESDMAKMAQEKEEALAKVASLEADLTKVSKEKDEALSKVESLESDVKKLSDEKKGLEDKVVKLEAEPSAPKGVLKVVGKGEDMSVSDNGKITDPAELLKMQWQQGGIRLL